MPTIFKQVLDIAEKRFSNVFGEKFNFVPMRQITNARPVIDSERDPVENIVGILVAMSENSGIGQGFGNRPIADVATIQPFISFEIEGLPEIRQGDVFIRQVNNQKYSVSSIKTDGLSRLKIHVNEIR